MKNTNKLYAAMLSLVVLAAILLTGCGAQKTPGASLGETGILTLRVNPEIQIEYNKQGQVTALTGKNDDGQKVLSSYQDYIGKDCNVVLEELINEIHRAGYFVDDVDGSSKNILLQLEPGSVLPADDFLQLMSASTQNAVKGLALASDIVTIDDDDYDPKYQKDDRPSPYITLEKAKEIALTQANVSAQDAVFAEKEFDHEDGTAIFELEFTAGGNEYEYDVDAVTGKILKAECQVAGATDYDDTDYGSNGDGVTDYSSAGNGSTDYDATDYASRNAGDHNTISTAPDSSDPGANNTDYDDTDYGPNNDGITDYDDTDYGPNNDGVTDYDDTDYGSDTDGATDYDDTDYSSDSDGKTDYDDTDDDADTDYGKKH